MDLTASVAKGEKSLIHALEERQAGVDDTTGKGSATERLIDERLLRPYLPPGFKSAKGEVVQTASNVASPPIDRIIYSERACPPLLVDEDHAVIPIEATAGVVEITVHMDAEKLKQDVARTKVVRAWRSHRYLVAAPGSPIMVNEVEATAPFGCRCFVIGLPASPNWQPDTIVKHFREALAADGGTHVHALYILGIGVFEKLESKIRAWLGPDRLFRFVTLFRQSFDRWPRLPEDATPDLAKYITGQQTNYPNQ